MLGAMSSRCSHRFEGSRLADEAIRGRTESVVLYRVEGERAR
jgi:hypothetical protein